MAATAELASPFFEPIASAVLTSEAPLAADEGEPAMSEAPAQVFTPSAVKEAPLEGAALSAHPHADKAHDGTSPVQLWLTGADERIQEHAFDAPQDSTLVTPITPADEDNRDAAGHPQDNPRQDNPR
jgi:hypothetical protein